MPDTMPAELLYNALNELRRAADRLYREAKEDDKLTPRIRASLSHINAESWKIQETVDQIEKDLSTEGKPCTL